MRLCAPLGRFEALFDSIASSCRRSLRVAFIRIGSAYVATSFHRSGGSLCRRSGVAGANITTIVRIERDESTGETIFEAHTPADLGEDLMVSEYGNHGVRGLFPIGVSVTW